MTIRDLMMESENIPLWTQMVALLIPPVFTLFCSLFHSGCDGNRWPWKYLYSIIVFSVFIPGIFSIVVIGYSIFMVYENLLDANVIFVFGPIASMFLTIQMMKWNHVNIIRLPGFNRLIALVLLIGAAAVGAIVILKTRILIFASFSDVFKLMLVLVVVMYIGYYYLFYDEDYDDGPGETPF